jgi:hypothetical protein
MYPRNEYAVGAEISYHRERVAHDMPAGRHHGRRWRGRHRRERLEVVQPYGDVRA